MSKYSASYLLVEFKDYLEENDLLEFANYFDRADQGNKDQGLGIAMFQETVLMSAVKICREIKHADHEELTNFTNNIGDLYQTVEEAKQMCRDEADHVDAGKGIIDHAFEWPIKIAKGALQKT